ncbi:hypothetical protein [Streptomyces sp. SID9124]|uniref:hypothetical protein n=1 Tax=Streptomyces sp. SID9124 TaxID=2706108 RepID=UPI0013DED9A7|nr:hypothetical protein [Streptomyces sp. SID9124]NED11856.1 hypothetical protein [Streptomyces sp. SID9124]
MVRTKLLAPLAAVAMCGGLLTGTTAPASAAGLCAAQRMTAADYAGTGPEGAGYEGTVRADNGNAGAVPDGQATLALTPNVGSADGEVRTIAAGVSPAERPFGQGGRDLNWSVEDLRIAFHARCAEDRHTVTGGTLEIVRTTDSGVFISSGSFTRTR